MKMSRTTKSNRCARGTRPHEGPVLAKDVKSIRAGSSAMALRSSRVSESDKTASHPMSAVLKRLLLFGSST